MSGNVGLMGRESLTSFTKTTQPELNKWLPRSWVKKYYKKDGILELWNESIIHFTHFDSMEHLHSYNIGWCGIDQMEQVAQEVFEGIAYERIRLKTFNRSVLQGRQLVPVNPPVEIPIHTVFGTCNPKRGWLYDKFVINDAYRKSEDKRIQGLWKPDFKLIEVSTDKNAMFLPDQYLSVQKENMSPREYRRRVEGKWDAFEGQVYIDFTDDLIADKDLTPHPSWKLYVGIDHGGTGMVPKNKANNITYMVFGALEKREGKYPIMHVFSELFLESSNIEETVLAIYSRLKSISYMQKRDYPESETQGVRDVAEVYQWRCDPSMNKKSGDTTETIMDAYMRHAKNCGLRMSLMPGDNEIDTGINKVAWFFAKKLVKVYPACRWYIDTHKTYEYGDNEKPKRGQNDHAPDGGRYMLSGVPLWWKNHREVKVKSIVDKHLEHLRGERVREERYYANAI